MIPVCLRKCQIDQSLSHTAEEGKKTVVSAPIKRALFFIADANLKHDVAYGTKELSYILGRK